MWILINILTHRILDSETASLCPVYKYKKTEGGFIYFEFLHYKFYKTVILFLLFF